MNKTIQCAQLPIKKRRSLITGQLNLNGEREQSGAVVLVHLIRKKQPSHEDVSDLHRARRLLRHNDRLATALYNSCLFAKRLLGSNVLAQVIFATVQHRPISPNFPIIQLLVTDAKFF